MLSFTHAEFPGRARFYFHQSGFREGGERKNHREREKHNSPDALFGVGVEAVLRPLFFPSAFLVFFLFTVVARH